jgi:hypothetical protein
MRRVGIVREVHSLSRYYILERADIGDGILCPVASVEDERSLTVGQFVTFDLTMDQRGRHLAKAVRLVTKESR